MLENTNNKTKFTVLEVSKLVGKKPVTIYRHIEKGKVSTELDYNGNKIIDASEIVRFYGVNPCKILNEISTSDENINQDISVDNKIDSKIIELLEKQLAEKDQIINSQRDTIKYHEDTQKELRQDLRTQIEINQRMLEAPKDEKPQATQSRGLLDRIFGK
jgi:hypothetical protein